MLEGLNSTRYSGILQSNRKNFVSHALIIKEFEHLLINSSLDRITPFFYERPIL